MSNACKVLLPYNSILHHDHHIRLSIDPNDNEWNYVVDGSIAYDDRQWCVVAMDKTLEGSYPTKEAAMKALDLILIENGYTLLTEEQAKKIEILL